MRALLVGVLLAAAPGCGGGASHAADGGDTDTGPPATLTITTFGLAGPENTDLVAVQDGDGPWTALTGTAGVYTGTIHGDRYGVMMACSSPTFGAGPEIYYGTVADGTAFDLQDCADLSGSAAVANLAGTITGAGSGDTTRLVDSYSDIIDVDPGSASYAFQTLPGPVTLFAEDLVGDRPVKVVRRDVVAVDGGSADFDFGSGFEPVTHALSAAGGLGAVELSYRDARGIAQLDFADAPVSDFRALPADQLGSGLNRLIVSNTDPTNPISIIRYFTEPADQTFTFPAALQLPAQPTATASPYPNVAFAMPIASSTALYDMQFSTTDPTSNAVASWYVEMTSAYVAATFPGATKLAYTFPDFHALPGWQAAFQAEAGAPLDWFVEAQQVTNIDWFPTVPPNTLFDHDGSELSFEDQSGELAAP